MTIDDRGFDLDDIDFSDVWETLPVDDSLMPMRGTKDRQLNLRVSSDLLSDLRSVATARNESYHALARGFIEQGLMREASVSEHAAPPVFTTKEATLVLLAAPGASRQPNEEILGRTRLQKLVFLLAQHLKPEVQARFEAYNYGPFDENLTSDIEFLESEGLIEGSGLDEMTVVPRSGDRGVRLVEWVRNRTGPASDVVDSYRLTKRGMDWVERFLSRPEYGDAEAKARLLRESSDLKEHYGRVSLDALIDHVYTEYPEYAEKSKIRARVAERRGMPNAR